MVLLRGHDTCLEVILNIVSYCMLILNGLKKLAIFNKTHLYLRWDRNRVRGKKAEKQVMLG